MVFMYAGTFQHEHIWTVYGAVLMAVIGIAFAYMMVGLRFEPFQFADFLESIVWAGISIALIWVVNKTVPFNLDVSPLSERLFSVLMAVAEECFFRLWLCTFIHKATRQGWLAIGLSSFFWAVYHFNRYGGAGTGVFLVIFMAGCALGWVMLNSKMGDGVIFAHAVVNFLA